MALRTWTGATSGDFAVTTNWAQGVVPVAGDDLLFPAGTPTNSLTTSLNQSAITVASITIDPAYAGQIGTATAYLQIGATTVNMPSPLPNVSATGATLVKLNHAAVAATYNIAFTNSTITNGLPAVQVLGTAITLNMTGGIAAVALTQGETATVTSAKLASASGSQGAFSVSGGPQLYLGTGATLTAATIGAGTVINYSAQTMPSIYQDGGVYDYRGSGAHTLIQNDAGTVYYSGTGTCTTFNCNGTVDGTRDPRAKTITTLRQTKGAVANLDNGGNFSVGTVRLYRCSLVDVTLNLGKHLKSSPVANDDV